MDPGLRLYIRIGFCQERHYQALNKGLIPTDNSSWKLGVRGPQNC